MGYAVRYRDASGATKLEDAASLEAALEQVERLRNEDGASDVAVFREVPIEVRTYYKAVAVEKEAGTSTDAPAASTGSPSVRQAEPPPGAMPIVPPATVRREAPAAPADDAKESAEDARRSSLFSRG